MKEEIISVDILNSYIKVDEKIIDELLAKEVAASREKIIVLDDDPTGIQTVHDISVYTDWSEGSIRKGFEEKNKIFFVLTNSRGFTEEQTRKAHTEIFLQINKIAKEMQKKYLIISRSDSTLRGHYPLETEILRKLCKEQNGYDLDGEVLCPYFKEGGRFTINNVHYVKYENELVPVGDTEFAKDETFAYSNSDLREYVVEKTKGKFRKEDCICISLESIRAMDIDQIEKLLMNATDFKKIIVNAIDDVDIKIFCIALYRAMKKGKKFMFRSAAALVKAIGNVSDKELLIREEMIKGQSHVGGLVIVGSHTNKTTAQLERLKELENIIFLELDSDLVLKNGKLEEDVERVLRQEEKYMKEGITVCVSTKRRVLKVNSDTAEKALVRSVKISNALKDCVGKLDITPSFVVAKGGITSSDVGIKALCVKKARVLGQIQPGIPVWQTEKESRFPGIPYIIFPGNVGEENTLKRVVEILL